MAKVKAGWFGLSVLVAFLPGTAWGQAASFGRAGQFAVSGERLLGVFVHKAETDLNTTATGGGPAGGSVTVDASTETDATEFVLLGNSDQVGPAGAPRIAFDFFPIDGLSIGGALLYEHHSAENDTTGTATFMGQSLAIDRTQTEIDTSVFGIAPRVGYAYMFTPNVGIWPRGGISYVTSNSEEKETVTDTTGGGGVQTTDTETTINHLSVAIDAMLVLSPVEHVGFGIGPFVEIPLSGDIEVSATQVNPDVQSDGDGDVKVTSYGLSSSLIVWFP